MTNKSTLFTAQVKKSITKQREQLELKRQEEWKQVFAKNAAIRAQETRAAGFEPLQRRR